MSLNLTTDYAIPNGKKLVFGKFEFDDDNGVLLVRVELRTAAATDALVCGFNMYVRDGTSTRLERKATPDAGLNIGDLERYFIVDANHQLLQRTTATGYTDAKAAERAAANNKNARRTALEAHMLSAGHVDPVSLAATAT